MGEGGEVRRIDTIGEGRPAGFGPSMRVVERGRVDGEAAGNTSGDGSWAGEAGVGSMGGEVYVGGGRVGAYGSEGGGGDVGQSGGEVQFSGNPSLTEYSALPGPRRQPSASAMREFHCRLPGCASLATVHQAYAAIESSWLSVAMEPMP